MSGPLTYDEIVRNYDPTTGVTSGMSNQFHTVKQMGPSPSDTRQHEDSAERRFMLDQALARGAISPEQYDNAVAGGVTKNSIDELMGFEQSAGSLLGGVGQGVVDVLSLPLYTAAAVSNAAIESKVGDGNAIDILGLKIGFSPSAFIESMQNRGTYSQIWRDHDLAGGGYAGFALDVALDPLMYLSFGVGAGAKVGVRGGTQVGGKVVKGTDEYLTLTRHGERMYKLAQHEMRGDITSRLAKVNADRTAKGLDELRHLPVEELALLHNQTGQFMIDNYARLQAELQRGIGRGKFLGPKEGKIRQMLGGGPESMFVETAGKLGQDIGMTADVGKTFGLIAGGGIGISAGNILGDTVPMLLGGVGGGVAGLKIADWAWGAGTSASRAFSRTKDLPEDVKSFVLETSNETQRMIRTSIDDIHENLAAITPEERILMTRAMDLGDEALVREESTGRILQALIDGGQLGDEVVAKMNYVRDEFQALLKMEHEAGFATEEVRDYIARIWKDPDGRALAEGSIRSNKATGNLALRSKHSFQFHRQVASLEDFIASVGKDFIEEDIAKILAKRKSLSIKMRQDEKIYEYLKASVGMPTAITYSAMRNGKRSAAGLKRILRQERGAEEARLWQFDQYYGVKDSIGHRLGFTGRAHGRDSLALIKYLTLEVGERLGAKPGFNPTAFANQFRQINTTFKYKTTGSTAGREVDAVTFLDAMYNGEDALSLLKLHAAKEGRQLTNRDVNSFIRNLDKWSRGQFEAPLLTMFPDFTKRLGISLEKDIKFGLKKPLVKDGKVIESLRVGTRRSLSKLEQQLKKPVKSKGIQAELPQEIMLRARMWRLRKGDYTDVSHISDKQANTIFSFSRQLGMTHGELGPIVEVLSGVDDIFKLNARQADRVSDFLGMHLKEEVTKMLARQSVGGKTFGGRNQVISSLFGEGAEVVTFGTKKMPYFEDLDSILSGRAKVAEPSIAEASAAARVSQLDRIIESRLRKIEHYKTRINEFSEKLSNSTLTPSAAKNLHVQLARAQHVIKSLNKSVEGLSAKKSALTSRPEMSLDVPRKVHIGQEEVGIVNREVLSEADQQYVNRKFGFSLSEVSAHNAGIGTGAAAKKALRSIRQKFKSAKKEHDTALKEFAAYDEKLALIDGPLTKGQLSHKTRLANKLVKTEKELFRIEAGLKGGKVTILGNGKYRVNETGKIYDLLMKKRGQGVEVIGNHSSDIQQAIMRDMVLNGRKKVGGYFAATADELPSTVAGVAGGKYVVPASVAHMLREMNSPLYNPATAELANRLLKGFDKIQNIYKIPLLAPWGSTWNRNAIGNITLSYLKTGIAMLHPNHMGPFMRAYVYALSKESPNFRKYAPGIDDAWMEKVGKMKVPHVLGEKYHGGITYAQLHEEMGRRGVLTGMHHEEVVLDAVGGPAGQASGTIMGAAIGAGLAGPVGGAIGAAGGFLAGNHLSKMRGLFKVGELATEMPTRMMLGMHTYQTTGSLREMGSTVNHFLHDYSQLTTFERRLVRRMMPFYNFTKLAFRSVLTGMVENPGRVMTPYKVFRSQNVTSGVQPEDYPDFYHHQMVWLTKEFNEEEGAFQSWVPGMSQQPSGVRVYSGVHPPLEEVLSLLDVVGPGGQDIKKLAARGPFGAMSIVEAITNYDTFRLSKIVPTEPGERTAFSRGNAFKSSPSWMKKLVQYDEESNTVNAKMAWLLGELPTSRFTRVAQQIYDTEDEITLAGYNYNAIAKAMLGLSIHRYDADTQRYFVNQAKIEAMENVLGNIGWLKKYESTYATGTGRAISRSRELQEQQNNARVTGPSGRYRPARRGRRERRR